MTNQNTSITFPTQTTDRGCPICDPRCPCCGRRLPQNRYPQWPVYPVPGPIWVVPEAHPDGFRVVC